MDKVLAYKGIIRAYVEEIYRMAPSSEEVETQLIIDDERGHYLLYSVGWEGHHWVYGSFVHLDVKPTGRVWLQHDGTDLGVAEELVRRGIPKDEIVIGFQKPSVRPHMAGWAVE